MNIINSVKNMNQFKYLLSQLVGRDFKVKYKRSVLGVLWSVLNPLLMMTVMGLVFQNLFFRFNTEPINHLVHIMTGLVFFNFFAEATNLAMSSIVGNFSLITKVYVPKYIFPLSKVILSLINLGFATLALYFIIFFTYVTNSDHNVFRGVNFAHLLLPYDFICIFLFALGVALFLAAFSVFFRDMFYIYGIILTTWTYLTPIMYPISIIPETYRFFFKLNPMYQYIEYARTIILTGQVPSLQQHLICLGMSLVTLAFGVWFFRRRQNDFIYYI